MVSIASKMRELANLIVWRRRGRRARGAALPLSLPLPNSSAMPGEAPGKIRGAKTLLGDTFDSRGMQSSVGAGACGFVRPLVPRPSAKGAGTATSTSTTARGGAGSNEMSPK